MAIVEIVSGLILAGAGLAGLFLSISLYNYIGRDMRPQRAVSRAAGNTTAVVVSFLSVAGMGLAQFFEVIDVTTLAIANHPIAATNIVTAVLGTLGIAGKLTAVSYLTAVVVFVGGFIIIKEVRG